jgi:hypothetical protein
MFSNKILTTTDHGLLISRLGLAEEVDGGDSTRLGKDGYIDVVVSSDVVVKKENAGEGEECQQSEHISGVTPEEGHGVG